MNTSDPIADFLTRVRNAQIAGHDMVTIPASRIKISIAHILKNEGFIRDYKCIRDNRQGILKIGLKYRPDGQGVISDLKRISRPSHRIYREASKLPFVRNGFGVGIYSTSKGLMTDRDARLQRVGGEYLCSVY